MCLLDHGCPDLTSKLNASSCSGYALAGGGFGDVWQGTLDDNARVAIKCLRFNALPEGTAKDIKV
jgi:predicted unusual protein kinase regulating ubiquinone biosynthesis (AarF/ABC1/UbiB family)